MAHKLAVLAYRMLRWGHEYVDKGMQYYEDRHREQQIRLLKKRAAKLARGIRYSSSSPPSSSPFNSHLAARERGTRARARGRR